MFNQYFLNSLLMGIAIWYVIIPLSLSVMFVFLTFSFLALKRKMSEHTSITIKEEKKDK